MSVDVASVIEITLGTANPGTSLTSGAVIADNAVVRGNGGARGVQDSGVLIDDSDNVSGVNTISIGSDIVFDSKTFVSASTGAADNDKLVTKGYVDDNTGSDEKVKVDSGAVAGFLGAAFNDGVLRSDGTVITYTDGGDFVTLALDQSQITTLGTIGTGVWEGTSIASDFIADAATWFAKQDALTFGIADTNSVVIDDADAADNDYAKFTASGLEGRSFAEVKTDLSLENVENTALSTWAGSSNLTTLGTIGTGIWEGTSVASDFIESAVIWNAAGGDYSDGGEVGGAARTLGNTDNFSMGILVDNFEALRVTPASSAVNYFNLTPSATTDPVILASDGTDPNIDIDVTPKGTGEINLNGAINIGDSKSINFTAGAESALINLSSSAWAFSSANEDIIFTTPKDFTFKNSASVLSPSAFRIGDSVGKLTGSSFEQSWMLLDPEIDQSGTAAWNGLKIDTTLTAEGDGSAGDGNNLLNLAVGGTSLFKVDKGSAFGGTELSADPAAPADGKYIIWMSDGTGSGNDGDMMISRTVGGTPQTDTLLAV